MTRAALTLAACTLMAAAARGQMFPGDRTPPATAPAAAAPLALLDPVIDKAKSEIRIPAAFWNEHLTDWIEVAICGRPSDFLHETVVCTTTTRSKMQDALRAVGFHDADAWADNVTDFPRIRGDRALITLEVQRNGKTATYCLDEMITYQGWNVSVGPFGWMYKGDPHGPATVPDIGLPVDAGAAPPGNAPLTVGEQILRDDPQAALQFRGIQHLSRSYIDHPLCYDDWIYPNLRYHRNYTLLPKEVYDSNGSVPVTMVVRKVTEAEFLKQAAAVWHDPEAGKFMLQQLPVAEQIDKDKAEYWALLPALREYTKKTKAGEAGAAMPLRGTKDGVQAALLQARIEKGYTALDYAWTDWACSHTKTDGPDAAGDLDELKASQKLWRQHMDQKRQAADWKYQAQQAEQKQHGGGDLITTSSVIQLRAAQEAHGAEIFARNKALLLENSQIMEYWQGQQARLAADDPRVDLRRQIMTEAALAACKAQLGEAGVAYGAALQGDDAALTATTEKVYQLATLRIAAAVLQTQLAEVNFEISKREGLEGDKDLPGLLKRREALLAQIKATDAAVQTAAAATQATTQPK